MAEARMFERIQWHEGMLLSPQQFQQESARVDALVGWQSLAAQPTAWGIRRLDIDEAALATGTLRILRIDVVFPNGMAACYDAVAGAQHGLELALAPYAQRMEEGELPVWLAVGATRSSRQPGQPCMFRGIETAAVEDEVSEALACEVPRMAPNLQLMAGKEPGAAYVALRLMDLFKAGEVVQRGAFCPAQLEMMPGAAIARRAAALAAQMRSKAVFIARQSAVPSSRQEDRLAIFEERARLASLVLHLPLLEAVLHAPALQPLPLYLALCAQLGPLSALRPGVVPIEPPAYRHEDSGAAFDTVLTALQGLVDEVSRAWKTCVFSFDGAAFSLPMRAEWLGKRLVVGLRGQGEQGERELAQWMDGVVIGSRNIWTALCERRMLGAPRERIEEAPELELRAGSGFALFAIAVTEEFIVAGQALQVSHPNDHLAAQRPQEMVLFVRGES